MKLHKRSQSEFNLINKFETKGNSENTILKFCNPHADVVLKLNYFSPQSAENNLFNLKRTTNIDEDPKKNKNNIKFRLSLPSIQANTNHNTLSPQMPHKILYMKRLENINIESTLDEKRIILESKFKQYKSEKKKLFQQLETLKKDAEELELEIEMFSKIPKNSTAQKSLNQLSLLGLKKTKESGLDKLMLKKIYDGENEKREATLFAKQKDLDKLRDPIIKIRESLNDLDNKIKAVFEDLKNVKNALMMHYHKILSEGKDTRKEGLSWIIKSIWQLGYKVIPSFLPDFLDEKAISYVFKYANKDTEFSKIKKKLDDVHLIMRAKREKKIIDSEKKNNQQATFKTALENENFLDEPNLFDENNELNKNVINFLIDRYKRDNHLDEETINIKNVNSIITTNKSMFANEEMDYIKSVQNLETQLRNIQIEMNNMRKAELDRVNKEFYTYDYERRYSVNLEIMVSVIVGEDNVANEIGKQRRDQEAYFKKLQSLRSYNMLSDINIQKYKKNNTGIAKSSCMSA